MGQKEGEKKEREQITACAMIGEADQADAATRDRDTMASVCPWCGAAPGPTPRGPRASPSRFSHHRMLAFSLSAVSHRRCQQGRRARIMRRVHSSRRTTERSCL